MTSAKKRILFVDDEPAILAGLQNLLYKDRKRWSMVFAGGGEQAIHELQQQAFDVVVSDMRMPGMDGATLLNRIKDEFPATGRIMLSGHAEREAIVRALPALHQLLSKPCNADTLRSAIERGIDNPSSSGDRVRAAIKRIDKLATPQALFREIANGFSSASTTIDDVTRIVMRDPALSAKVLQLINSGYFGTGERCTSIPKAVAILGVDRLSYIWHTAPVFTTAPTYEARISELQAKAARTATLTAALLDDEDGSAYAAALFHDVGRMVALLELGDEAATCGVTHPEIGGRMLALWGLPTTIVDAVRYQASPDLAPEPARAIAAAIHVAEAIAAGAEARIDTDALGRAGFAGQLAGWIATAREIQ
ncbi:MAG: HDOD domain-containing protein [Kofleriaceae bacterium]